MSKRLLNALMVRLRRRYAPVVAGVARLKDKEMADALRGKAALAMEYMDDVSASKASFKDLAMAAGVMVDKAQLLEGKPTQITGNEERKKLDELLPRLVEEAGRRGITLEGEKVPRLIEEARRRGIPIEGLKTTYTVEKNDSEKKGE